MKRILTYVVGALDIKEVESIIVFNSTKHVCDVVNVDILRKFPERFPWKDDAKAMEIINKEISSGPFNFVVLFFVEKESK